MPNPMTWQAVRRKMSLPQAVMPRYMLSLYGKERFSALPFCDANHTS